MPFGLNYILCVYFFAPVLLASLLHYPNLPIKKKKKKLCLGFCVGWVCHGLFPNSLTNNMVFQFCFKSKKILEVLGTTLGMPF